VIRVTADINSLVSALTFPNGSPRRLLELARTGEIELAVSDAILDELADVMVRKFDWPDVDVREARRQFGLFARHVAPADAVHAVADDPDDNAILECAATAGSDYIVSGDRHLLQLGSFRGVRLLKAADVLAILASQSID
jgi:putative PIN family toxin of toxin-antitoxin system